MSTLANELHPSKAPAPMLVTDAGMATLVNELHPAKAYSSMRVTDVGMSARVNALHPRKVNPPMLVTDVGIVTLVTFSLSTPHSRHESCPSPRKSDPVMLAVPSGIAKCTPPPDGGADAVAMFLLRGIWSSSKKKCLSAKDSAVLYLIPLL